MMKLNSNLAEVVGAKAIRDGLNIKHPHMISILVNQIMQRHIDGDFDKILEKLEPIDAATPKSLAKLMVNLEVKRASQTKAHDDGHILKHYKHNRFIEKLLRMYLKDEIKLK